MTITTDNLTESTFIDVLTKNANNSDIMNFIHNFIGANTELIIKRIPFQIKNSYDQMPPSHLDVYKQTLIDIATKNNITITSATKIVIINAKATILNGTFKGKSGKVINYDTLTKIITIRIDDLTTINTPVTNIIQNLY